MDDYPRSFLRPPAAAKKTESVAPTAIVQFIYDEPHPGRKFVIAVAAVVVVLFAISAVVVLLGAL